MHKRRRLKILCILLAQMAPFFRAISPFHLLLFPFLFLQALELNGAGFNLTWTTKAYETGVSLKSSKLNSWPTGGSTASNPFLRDICLSCFLRSPVMEPPQSINSNPFQCFRCFHPCWELSCLSTEKKITLFSPSLQWCETRLVFLWALFSSSASLFNFQTPNCTLYYSPDLTKEKL